jgi:hypothetical protein
MVLAAFLPDFADPGYSFGSWGSTKQDVAGRSRLGYFMGSESLSHWMTACYESGWVDRELDWIEWQGTEEAQALRQDPDRLAAATPRELQCLLTALIRSDRFVEGALGEAFESGLIRGIVERASVLLSEGR